MSIQIHELQHSPRRLRAPHPLDDVKPNGRHRAFSPHETTVLVADDETYIVDVLAITLEDEGYRVLRAYDGKQAWEVITSEHPSLILSDIMMPHLGGVDLVKRLRATDEYCRVPVILMSAGVRQVPGLDVAFLPKPFDLDQMLRLVVVTVSS